MSSDGFVGVEEINRRMGEKVLESTPGRPHDPEEYSADKLFGRRMPNGASKLKRLTTRHKSVIALYLRGLSFRDISFVTGLSEVHVANVVKDPLAQEVIEHYIEGMEDELRALAPQAVDALRSGLEDEDVKVRLNAADRFFKATGRYDKASDKKETAEDVLARALARVAAENATTLREVTRQRGPSANTLPAPDDPIDITPDAEE